MSPLTATCLALLGFAAGCVNYASLSSGETGCPTNEIEISDLREPPAGARTWTATCRGYRHYCTLTTDVVSCNRESDLATSGGSTSESVGATTATASPSSQVERVVRDGTPRIQAWADAGEGFRLHVVTTFPDLHSVVVVQTPGEASFRDCDVRFMLDGELMELANVEFSARNRSGWLEATVEYDVVERLASAERVVGRVCDDELRLNDHGRQVLDELIMRVQEERAFSAGSSSDDPEPASVPDADGESPPE